MRVTRKGKKAKFKTFCSENNPFKKVHLTVFFFAPSEAKQSYQYSFCFIPSMLYLYTDTGRKIILYLNSSPERLGLKPTDCNN